MALTLTFVADVVIVSLVVGFVMSLAVKWGWLEWAQVHAPGKLIYELLMCKFCTSFWLSVVVSLVGWAVSGQWYIVLVPFCSTVIARELW